jgi:hypothetical protein
MELQRVYSPVRKAKAFVYAITDPRIIDSLNDYMCTCFLLRFRISQEAITLEDET